MTNGAAHASNRVDDGMRIEIIYTGQDYHISHCSILIKTNHPLYDLVLVFEYYTQIHLHSFGFTQKILIIMAGDQSCFVTHCISVC